MPRRSDYYGMKVPILFPPEAVRLRPIMYLGSTDQQGLHQLLRYALEGLLWHYRHLKQPLDCMRVQLEADGSVTLISVASDVSAAFLEQNVEWMKNALAVWGSRTYYGLIFANAFCARLSMKARGFHQQWRFLAFEQGVLQSEEFHSRPPDETCDIWLRLWPDFTILKPGAFDTQEIVALVGSLSCPPHFFVREPGASGGQEKAELIDNDPAVAITVIDTRPPPA